MKRNLFSSMRMHLSGLLLGSITLFSSCSKEQDVIPAEAPTAVTTQANALRVEGAAVAGNVAYFRYDSGGYFYGPILSHTEIATQVRLEFWQGAQLVFVARDAESYIADYTAGNVARYLGVDFVIPIMLAPGNYTLVIRTQSDDKSLVVATTNDPSTYVHSLSTPFAISPNENAIRMGTGLYATPVVGPYYNSCPFTWNTAKFAYNSSLRAFAKNQTTGTLYQLSPAYNSKWNGDGSDGSPITFAIQNSGYETVVLNEPGKPEYLPAGTYSRFLDNHSSLFIGGPSIVVGQ